MKLKLSVVVLLIAQLLYSQEFASEFGKISQSEIDMKFYEKDPDAGAVVLFDVGESKFVYIDQVGYNIEFVRHKRIKIFNESEFHKAEISIDYYVDVNRKKENVKSIEAISYNYINGEVSKQVLDMSNVYDEKINKNWRRKKFVFPNVQKGSVLELRYVLETPFHFNLPDWTFQSDIPVAYSQYTANMIPFYEYSFIAQGISKFDYQKSSISKVDRRWGNISESFGENICYGVKFNDYIHTYGMKDIPALNDESYISSINDYIMKIDFQLHKFNSPSGVTTNIMSTWPELNKSLLKSKKFGKYIKNSSKISKKILENDISIGGLTDKEKSKKILKYVKDNFTWNGYNSKYSSKTAKEFFKTKIGNSADINLFLIAMLNRAEINAKPVILSTRNHGKIKSSYPFDHFTNYVVAKIYIESPFMADATSSVLAYNRLPIRCINGIGLVVDEIDNTKWINLKREILSI